jgi:hypothetical protein
LVVARKVLRLIQNENGKEELNGLVRTLQKHKKNLAAIFFQKPI